MHRRRNLTGAAAEPLRILVAGHVAWVVSVLVEDYPRPDRNSMVRALRGHPGGAGGNLAAALSQLGAEVLLCSRVGADSVGRRLRGEMERYGVDTALVGDSIRQTTEFIVIADARGRRSFFIDPATAAFDYPYGHDGIPWSALSGVCISGMDLSGSAALVEEAERNRVPVALNAGLPAAAGELDDSWLPVVRACDAVFLNRPELNALPPSARRALHSRDTGPARLIVTDGSRPAIVYADGSSRAIASPRAPADNLSTLGCGDAYMAAFVSALWSGAGLAACSEAGHLAAEVVARSPDERSPQHDFSAACALISGARPPQDPARDA